MKEEETKKIREEKRQQLGMSWCCIWDSIDDLPINEHQKACVLERLAQRLQKTKIAKNMDIWQYCKSYDPLDIDVEHKVAHSYVMNMNDWWRHHDFKSMKDIDDCIFNEFFNEIEKEIEYIKWDVLID